MMAENHPQDSLFASQDPGSRQLSFTRQDINANAASSSARLNCRTSGLDDAADSRRSNLDAVQRARHADSQRSRLILASRFPTSPMDHPSPNPFPSRTVKMKPANHSSPLSAGTQLTTDLGDCHREQSPPILNITRSASMHKSSEMQGVYEKSGKSLLQRLDSGEFVRLENLDPTGA